MQSLLKLSADTFVKASAEALLQLYAVALTVLLHLF